MKNSKIFVAGHNGMVGSSLVRTLKHNSYQNILLASRSELDLTNQKDVFLFLQQHRPDYIFIAAAKVGGIYANNTFRAEFIYQNLVIATNLIHAAWQLGVNRLLFLGSSCIYPRQCPQPILEEYLLSSPLEPTNEPYALAKIAGLKMCESYNRQYGTEYVCVMPTNLYGQNDNYHSNNSHVIPALIRKCHEAKVNHMPSISLWGTGSPRREFLYVDDLSNACITLMETQSKPKHDVYNVGMGDDLSIRELATIIAKVVGFTGELRFDVNQLDGPPQKLLNIDRISELGWSPTIKLEDGLRIAYSHFLEKLKESDFA